MANNSSDKSQKRELTPHPNEKPTLRPLIIAASQYNPDADPHRFWSKWGPKSMNEWKRPWWLDGAE